jgi:RNA-directed DNA polymerase
MNHRVHYPSETKPSWSSIRWRHVNHTVEHLQHRITKAAERGSYRRVRDLQRLLNRSLASRLTAVRRVAQENSGKNSPGIDGVIWTTPDQKYRGALELRNRSTTKPLRRVTKPKTNGKMRRLGLPCMDDRARQALMLTSMLPVVEAHSDHHSYGFRPYRDARDAGAQLRHLLDKPTSPTWVLDADIEACFDVIDHDWLLNHAPMDRKLLKSWLKAGVIENAELTPTESGTPQGGVISPTLANLTLDGLEDHIRKSFPHAKRVRTLLNVVRYADDFVVTGRSPRQLERVKASINTWLRDRGLRLNESKTSIVRIDCGFDFLGWHIRKYDGRLNITISLASQRQHRREIKRLTKMVMDPVRLIEELNKKAAGWMRYHRATNRLWQVWRSMNDYRYHCLIKWGMKRHRNKTRAWVWRRYWRRRDARWTFVATKHNNTDLSESEVRLKPYNRMSSAYRPSCSRDNQRKRSCQ